MTSLKASGQAPALRDTLFGDLPLELWPSSSGDEFPWSAFAAARAALLGGDRTNAVRRWREVVTRPGLESRHYAQAWHYLRLQGERPPDGIAQQVLGVVMEVALAEGLDLLAAYPDGRARYYNYSGAGVVWERPDDSLDGLINPLLSTAADVVKMIGPWEGPRPPAPPADHARISFLTPSGIHFGEGPMNDLMADSMAGPLLQQGVALMQGLISRSAER